MEDYIESKETIERLSKNILLYPIGKCFLQKYQPAHDIINTFEDAMGHLEEILNKESILNEHIHTKIDNVIVKFKLHINNIRFFSPNSAEFKLHSEKFCSASTPNEALLLRKTYSMLIVGDINYTYSIIHIDQKIESKTFTSMVKDGYRVNIPIPIGCKWCTTRQYDNLTLIRSAEDMDGINGFFIIGGIIKYLIPYYQKPFNMPIIMKNNYDNQLSRSEGIYSSGLNYENSYYIIASMVKPKAAHMGRGISQIPIIDFIFSLQMNDDVMNQEVTIGRKKALINAVPIKYLFWAFGCTNDLEMLKYICPDLNDFGLIHTIRQSCLEGDYHIKAIQGLVDYSVQGGYLYIKNLDYYTSRYIIGNIILSRDYKDKVRKDCKQDIDLYKLEIIRQVDRLLRTTFMPGVGKMHMDTTLYDIDQKNLTVEQKKKIQDQERLRNKAICFEIGQIVRELYQIGNNITPSMDKISLLNKRIRSGQQIEHEYKSFNRVRMREARLGIEKFFSTFNDAQYLTNEKTQIDLNKEIENIGVQISGSQSKSLLNSFKGTATKERSKMRTNQLTPKNQSFLSAMLREIVISTDQKATGTGVQWEHRVVHPSHLYFIDAVYCPEAGPQVGRYQQPTLYTYLTVSSKGRDVVDFIKQDKNFQEYSETIGSKYLIKFNGSTVGYIDQYEPIETLYKNLMKARAVGKIAKDCSITVDHFKGLMNIWCDEGRIMSPFVSVANCFEISGKTIGIRPNFRKWLEKCAVEECFDEGVENMFIQLYDPDMAAHNITIAPTIQDYYEKPWLYSHIALPLHTLSFVTCINPCVQLNAGVRASYSSNHMKQAIGPTFRYPQIKYIDESNVLLSPQIPLVRTCAYDTTRMTEKPCGQNITIAFLMYTNNQEDSFIINRSSIEAGLFIIDSYSVQTAQCEKHEETFQVPDELVPKNGNPESYKRLDSKTCLPKNVGDKFFEGDAMIAKIAQLDPNNRTMTDRSTINNKPDAWHPRESNTRELRCVCKDRANDENTKFKMVCSGQRRIGIAGDKFNSCHAQKGTIGRVYESKLIPYTADGLRPDIIFNPPSIFKRKTSGQVYEPMVGKLAAWLGCPVDTTPYSTMRTTEELDYLCEQVGLDKFGYEDLYDPESGRLMGKVFIGVMQMQRQQHLVENKLNIRNGEGDLDRISGLSVKGRRRSGGQSVDRMSNDAINASGAVMINQDIHLNQGAKTTIAFCNKCHHQFTYYSQDYKSWFCQNCGRHTDFTIKEVVPAANLINYILTGMHVCWEYKTEYPGDDKDIINDIDMEIS